MSKMNKFENGSLVTMLLKVLKFVKFVIKYIKLDLVMFS